MYIYVAKRLLNYLVLCGAAYVTVNHTDVKFNCNPNFLKDARCFYLIILGQSMLYVPQKYIYLSLDFTIV